MALRAGVGGLQFNDPTGKKDAAGRPVQVHIAPHAEVGPSVLPKGTNIEALIAGGILEQDAPAEVKTEEAPEPEAPKGGKSRK